MHKILYLAETGGGKTSSLRNLSPKDTAIVNIDKKALPLKGWRANYLTIRDTAGKVDFGRTNYIEAESPGTVMRILEAWESQEWVRTIAIDTITHMVTHDYMNNAIGKDFKAYQTMGKNFYEIIEFVRDSKKNVIVMGHIGRKIDEMGNVVWDIRTQGKIKSCPYSLNSVKLPMGQYRAKLLFKRRCNDYPLCSGVSSRNN